MTTDDEYRIRIDRSTNDPKTGIEKTRMIVMKYPTWGTKTFGAKAVFEWDHVDQTYRLNSYRRQKYRHNKWQDTTGDFGPEDVGYLERIADHLRETSNGTVTVELFPSPENE